MRNCVGYAEERLCMSLFCLVKLLPNSLPHLPKVIAFFPPLHSSILWSTKMFSIHALILPFLLAFSYLSFNVLPYVIGCVLRYPILKCMWSRPFRTTSGKEKCQTQEIIKAFFLWPQTQWYKVLLHSSLVGIHMGVLWACHTQKSVAITNL